VTLMVSLVGTTLIRMVRTRWQGQWKRHRQRHWQLAGRDHRQVVRQSRRSTAIADGLLALPHKDVVHHGAAAEDDAHADQQAGHDRRRGVEMAEGVQDQAGEEDRYGDEEAADGARAAGTRLGQVLVLPSLEGRLAQLHGEQELDGADQEAAQVQRQRERAQGQGDVVHDDEVLAAGSSTHCVLASVRRDPQQEDQREQRQEQGN